MNAPVIAAACVLYSGGPPPEAVEPPANATEQAETWPYFPELGGTYGGSLTTLAEFPTRDLFMLQAEPEATSLESDYAKKLYEVNRKSAELNQQLEELRQEIAQQGSALNERDGGSFPIRVFRCDRNGVIRSEIAEVSVYTIPARR